jgi:hypothetical protein
LNTSHFHGIFFNRALFFGSGEWENGYLISRTSQVSVFVSKEWEGPIIPGYRGFLERIRFALDPGVVPGEQVFYFGLVEILIFYKRG